MQNVASYEEMRTATETRTRHPVRHTRTRGLPFDLPYIQLPPKFFPKALNRQHNISSEFFYITTKRGILCEEGIKNPRENTFSIDFSSRLW